MEKKRLIKIISLFLLLSIFLLLVFFSGKDNFPLYHEGEIMFNGYSYLKYGNSIGQSSYPLVSSSLSALPLLFLNVDYPEDFNYSNPKEFAQEEFLYYIENNAKELIFWSRIPFIVISLILGTFIFIWSNQLYGYKSGILSLVLFAFSPLILAYTPIINADFIMASFMFISTYFFWRFYTEPKKLPLVLCGIFLGLAIGSKIPALILLPIYGIICIIGFYKKKTITFPKKRSYFLNLGIILLILSIISVIIFLTVHLKEIHPIYYADDPLYIHSGTRTEERLTDIINSLPFESTITKQSIEYLVTKMPIPAPHFFQGLYSITHSFSKGSDTVFFGEHYISTIKAPFYILILLFKTPLPLILIIILGITFYPKNKSKFSFSSLFLLVPMFIYPLQFLLTKVYGGILYLIPFYLYLFILVGNITNYKEWKKRSFRTICIVLLGAYIITALLIFPHYLSYFNLLAGGSANGPYVSLYDSDYQQDLYRLEEYLEENNINSIKINYYSYSSTLQYQDFNFTYLPPNEPQEGLIAIDSYALIGLKEKDQNNFSWLREYEPIDKIGETIYIYNVSNKIEKNI